MDNYRMLNIGESEANPLELSAEWPAADTRALPSRWSTFVLVEVCERAKAWAGRLGDLMTSCGLLRCVRICFRCHPLASGNSGAPFTLGLRSEAICPTGTG